ncbi:geranyllinalool synthase [Sarracenia purpurea var. burkii]
MGFGREKTTYCYFAVAASCSLPHDSIVRLLVAKTAILITVADDFFDMEGSLHELRALAAAVQRWDGKGLSGHGKIIFEALDDFVSDIGKKHLHQQGSDVTEYLRDIKETLDGKSNLVLLHQKWHPQAKIEDSIAYVQEILDQKKRELMERALIDGGSDDLPMPSKLLHLSCLKVFQMFFNSSNRFDSETDLLDDVKRAIFVPPGNRIPITLVPSSPETKRKHFTIQASLIGKLKCQVTGALRGRRSPSTGSYVGRQKLTFPPKFTFGFV